MDDIENAKRECERYRLLYENADNALAYWEEKCRRLEIENKKVNNIIQSIIEIAQDVIDNDNSLKTDNCFGYCGECSNSKNCELYPYWLIRQLITKTEGNNG